LNISAKVLNNRTEENKHKNFLSYDKLYKTNFNKHYIQTMYYER